MEEIKTEVELLPKGTAKNIIKSVTSFEAWLQKWKDYHLKKKQ